MAGHLTLAKQAIEHYGWQHQIRKCAEEFSEAASKLLKMLEKHEAGKMSKKVIREALEECCDSDITLDQVKIILAEFTKSEVAFRDKKLEKENKLFDKICADRDKRAFARNRGVSSSKATRFQRGDCIKQGRSRTV